MSPKALMRCPPQGSVRSSAAAAFKRWLLISLLLGSMLTSFRASGQNAMESVDQEKLRDLDIERLMEVDVKSVYGASKYIQKITEAPSSITVITRAEIERYAYKTLADILNSVRGFFYTNDLNYDRIGIRGFNRTGDYNARLQVLIDGRRVNEIIFDSMGIGTDFILDVGLIERVEVVRGANASIYGNNAFFGVINIFTRNGASFQGTEALMEVGSLGLYAGRVTYGGRSAGGLDATVSGSWYRTQGRKKVYFPEFDTPGTNNGVAENLDQDWSYKGFGRLSWKGLRVESAFSSRTKQIPTGSYETVFDRRGTHSRDDYGYVTANFEHPVGVKTKVVTQAFYGWTKYSGRYIYDFSDPGDPPLYVSNVDRATGDWLGAEVFGSTEISGRTIFSYGAAAQFNVRQDQINYDDTPRTTYLDDKRKSAFYSLYAQSEVNALQSLRINIGLRYDGYSTFGGTVNPRVGLIYLPNVSTAVKLLYGRSYRAPNVYEAYYDGPVEKINPALKPERIHSGELIWEQGLGPYLQFTAAGFVYRIEGLISQILDPTDSLLVFRNTERIDAGGFETELEAQLPSGIQGRASYSVQRSRDRFRAQRLTNSPDQLVKLNVSSPLPKVRMVTSMDTNYLSGRSTEKGPVAPAHWITNITVSTANLVPSVTLTAGVHNVFNSSIYDPGGAEHLQDLLPREGRTAFIRANVRF